MFTQKWISRWWGIDSIVVYPPVETKTQKSTRLLDNKILSVGRFMSTKHHHSKNQLQLVRALKRINRSRPNYSLTLIGGLSKSEEKYFGKVVKESASHPVEILPNATSSQLADSISNATFFWHAAGLGQPSRKPQNFEHFGIAPIEAMAAGLIPLVYEKGGPAEVLRDFPELIYANISELVSKTKSLDPGQISDLSKKMISLSQKYDTKVFAKRIDELLRLLD
jgi:glycosyltransferase involved in cell wall biosynthesis